MRAAIDAERRGESTLDFLFVLAVGLVAGTLSGIVGTGSSIMLMPVLVYEYGPKEAVPIMAGGGGVGEPSRLPGGGGGGGWGARPGRSVPRPPAAGPRGRARPG